MRQLENVWNKQQDSDLNICGLSASPSLLLVQNNCLLIALQYS